MDRGRRPAPAVESDVGAMAGVVPSRAVLTELARGFLMLQTSDPDRAARFAATFVRERSTEPRDQSVTLLPRLPQIRRTAWAPPSVWSGDEGRKP